MVKQGYFQELKEEEILQLSTTPHLFTFYNYVFNGNSQSTPYRMISNTSNIAAGTTISVEQLSPSQILNPQENSLIRFQLYAVPLAGDVKSAYHTIKVDTASTYLRLFFWWHDLPEATQARLFRQMTQSFGCLQAGSHNCQVYLQHCSTG